MRRGLTPRFLECKYRTECEKYYIRLRDEDAGFPDERHF